VLFVVGVLLLHACSDSTRPAIDYRIQGQVSDVDGALSGITVRVDRVDLASPDFYRVEVFTDSTGRFVAWVPEGDYRVAINVGGEEERYIYWGGSGPKPHPGQAVPVAVRAGSSVGGLDCRLGGFDLEVETGAEREGKTLRWRLRTPVLDDPIYIAGARVENGVARIEGRRIPPGEYRLFLEDGFSLREGADIAVTEPGEAGTSPFVRAEPDRYRAYTYDLARPAQVTFRVQADLPLDEIFTVILGLYDANLGSAAPPFLTWSGRPDEFGRITVPVAFPRALRTHVAWNLLQPPRAVGAGRWIDSYSRTDAFVRQVTPGQDPGEIVTSGRTLELTLYRPPLMTTSLSARVDITDLDGEVVTGLTVTVTGDSSVFRLTNLLPGEHLVRLSAGTSRVVTQWYDADGGTEESIEGATPVSIPAAGPIRQISWSPTLGASFSGRVVDGDDSPMVGNFVFLTSDQGRGVIADMGRTDEEGRFHGGGFGRGRYKLGVYESPVTRWYPGVADWDSATVIVIDELTDYGSLDMVFR
jgi:hypothetical protein